VCGICGLAFQNRSSEAESRVRAMARSMRHRGPDGEGFLVNDPRAPGLALGMRRLAIIDLAGGQQPIWNETREVAVVYNGELYNYRELRDRLVRCGHRFLTESDTEILVHAWEEWGEECLHELRGMFAFAIVDLRKHYNDGPVLFLARDPLGIKPLYYAQTAEGFAFASEVRALMASGIAPRRISQDALTSFLLFGSVSEPVTMFEGVFSVPPGHRVMLYIPDRRRLPRPHPWWDARRTAAAKDPRRPRDFQSAAGVLRGLLEDSVRAHLIADVPIGLFLSSGLDSGAIAALAGRQHPGIQSFTLSFPGTAFDESALTSVVARRCGTKHAEIPLNGDAIPSRLDEALAALDQPTMDGINTCFVSWAAREVGLKVALSGLGADELFAGYSTFADTPRLVRLAQGARFVPRRLRGASAGFVRSLSRGRSADARLKLSAAWRDPARLPHPYYFARALFPPGELEKLTDPRFRPSSVGADGHTLEPTWLGWLQSVADEARRMEPVGSVSWLELRSYLVSTLLRDTDGVSMGRSLEVRVPMLDTPLVEFTSVLPDAARRKAGVQKALLVEAIGALLPREIAAQKKKTFTLPWEHWLRGPLKSRVDGSLHSLAPPLESVLKPAGVLSVWRSFLESRTSWSRPWALFVLNEWVRANVSDGPAAG
jgi:asparagine synthase (glutamine-hydrolysing)